MLLPNKELMGLVLLDYSTSILGFHLGAFLILNHRRGLRWGVSELEPMLGSGLERIEPAGDSLSESPSTFLSLGFSMN